MLSRAFQLLATFGLFLALNASAAVTHYVNLNNPGPASPFTSWATAATNIQDAVDAANPGDTVLVTNGVYATGGRLVPPYSLTNRVVVDKSVAVQSVNGPASTIISGHQVPGTTNGSAGIRCAYLTNGASLTGFTLTNGATLSTGDRDFEEAGGGAWCASSNAFMSNCLVIGNAAYTAGGGIRGGLIYHCQIISNRVTDATLLGGGGAYQGNFNDCTFFGNYSSSQGGGTAFAALNNCLIISNLSQTAGGAYLSALQGCTVISNVGTNFSVGVGGITGGTASNCILYFNISVFTQYSNYTTTGLVGCCTLPLPTSGLGNITNEPLFVNRTGGDFHLQSNSPCINAGDNTYVTNGTDFDGNPRISGGTVDIGAYEYQSPTSLLSYAWLQQYGLPTDGSADFLDPDHDGMNNWQEWRAGTNPTNSASTLSILSPTNSGTNIIITWQSVTNEFYYLQRGTNLNAQPVFQPLATNLVGHAGTTSYTDTNATGPGPFFYRVGVQ